MKAKILIVLAIIVSSLLGGVAGYHYFIRQNCNVLRVTYTVPTELLPYTAYWMPALQQNEIFSCDRWDVTYNEIEDKDADQ